MFYISIQVLALTPSDLKRKTSASENEPYVKSKREIPPPEAKEDNPPKGCAADLIGYTDDDVDGTDYKDMPDYDPDQEFSAYESSTEATSGPETFPKADAFGESFHSRNNIRLQSKSHSDAEMSTSSMPTPSCSSFSFVSPLRKLFPTHSRRTWET